MGEYLIFKVILLPKLTKEIKEKTIKEIWDSMLPDDRLPQEVVDDKFEGHWDEYLKCMACWHGIVSPGYFD